jgi:hypothetical protein
MQHCELYGRILGIVAPPWRVERLELQLKQGECTSIWPMNTNWSSPVPNAGPVAPFTIIKLRGNGGILIPASTARPILHAAPPRCQCSENGVRVVPLPWAEAYSRSTALMEGLAIA